MEGPAGSRFIPPCVGNSPAANPLQIAAVPSSRRYGHPRKKAAGVNPPPEGARSFTRLRCRRPRCPPGPHQRCARQLACAPDRRVWRG